MKIKHNINDEVVEREVSCPVHFLLANRIGGYLSLSSGPNVSRYQGLYFLKSRHLLVKTVDSFILDKKEDSIINNGYNIERKYDKATERFSFILNSDTLVYELEKYFGNLTIQLDTREIYDFSDKGREFLIRREKDSVIITYNKKEDKKYTAYIVIKGIYDFEVLGEYVEQNYSFDKKRNSYPNKWWVYKGIKVKIDNSKRLVISCGDNLQKVKYEAENVFLHLDEKLEINKKQIILHIKESKIQIPDKEIDSAYMNSLNAINNLCCTIESKRGTYAGLWWFFQWWSRDEAISSKSLMILEQYMYVKEMLMRQIEVIFDDGRAPNIYPHEGASSADGIGWTFKRIFDFIYLLRQKKLEHLYFNENDYILILSKLETSLERLNKTYLENGFFKSGYNETWMDTCGDARNGCRIEIQALILNMYKVASYLYDIVGDKNKSQIYKEAHDKFKKHIKQFFFSGFELADGIKDKVVDFTIRPNIFLTYYIAPQILSNEEWNKVFDNALPALLIEWGIDKCGICSIDKKHKQFITEYSGENNISYHFGDVWYYINNIVAICLFRLDSDKYKNTLQKLIHTSTEEILWNGIVGYHAEVSSACEFRSEAALAQAWSSATYVELINEIYGK